MVRSVVNSPPSLNDGKGDGDVELFKISLPVWSRDTERVWASLGGLRNTVDISVKLEPRYKLIVK